MRIHHAESRDLLELSPLQRDHGAAPNAPGPGAHALRRLSFAVDGRSTRPDPVLLPWPATIRSRITLPEAMQRLPLPAATRRTPAGADQGERDHERDAAARWPDCRRSAPRRRRAAAQSYCCGWTHAYQSVAFRGVTQDSIPANSAVSGPGGVWDCRWVRGPCTPGKRLLLLLAGPRPAHERTAREQAGSHFMGPRDAGLVLRGNARWGRDLGREDLGLARSRQCNCSRDTPSTRRRASRGGWGDSMSPGGWAGRASTEEP